MATPTENALAFRALHRRERAFIIPNPTTSMGYAFSAGQRDNAIDRDRMMKHVSETAAATELPVSADLENGFGDAPEFVAETIRCAAGAGVVGGSIEDATGRSDQPIYEMEPAADRIRASAAVARNLPFAFTLTARAENYLHGHADLKDTIKRLQAYQEAGADVLYAPRLVTKDDIAAVVSSVARGAR